MISTNYISTDFLQLKQVGHLSPEDAMTYLRQVGINNVNLCQSLSAYASVKSGQVHPLYLGLGIDIVQQAREQGITLTAEDFFTTPDFINKAQVLLEQLLASVNANVQNAICALLACRAFNFDLYCKLGEALNFSVCRAEFDLLIQFSFVRRAEQWGWDWYRVHKQLQQLDYEPRNKQVRQAHAVLEQYYYNQGNITEAIYHANQLNWERGVEEWIGQFITALKEDRYETCRKLLEIRNELSIKSHFQLGIIFQFEGDYFVRIAQYNVAEQVYLEAIESYRQAMKNESNYMDACDNMGGMLIKLGQLQAALSRHEKALLNYRQSISAFDRILSLDLNRISAYSNKGLALQSVSHIHASLSRYEEAIQSYQAAIHTYDKALKRSPNDYYLVNDKAIALQGLGDLNAYLSKPDEAVDNYEQAIGACNQAINIKIDFMPAYANKGLAFASLGELQTKLFQQQQALHSHEQAINSLQQALTLTPDDIHILNHLGATLHRLGLLKEILAAHHEAEEDYKYAIDIFDKILYRSPKSSKVYDSKGRVLHKLGFLQAKLGNQEQAMQSWQAALADFSCSLEIFPNNEDIRNLRSLLQNFLEQ